MDEPLPHNEIRPGSEGCWTCGGRGLVDVDDFGEVRWISTRTRPEDSEWCWDCQGPSAPSSPTQ